MELGELKWLVGGLQKSFQFYHVHLSSLDIHKEPPDGVLGIILLEIILLVSYRTLCGRDQRKKCTLNFIKYTLSRQTASSTTKSALLHRKECFIRSI